MDLYTETLNLLDADPRTINEIAAAAGVNRHWLEKFRQRKYDNPRVQSVQALYNHLSGRNREDAA